MATPAGVIVTRPVPAASAGPDLNRVMLGSEGVLGIITQATMRVHPAPEAKHYSGLFFRSFEDGIAAIHDCVERGLAPSMIRLQDSTETEFAFHMKAPPAGLGAVIQRAVKAYLRAQRYIAPCIMVVGFEGSAESVRDRRRRTLRAMRRHGAFPLGEKVGSSWAKDKFNLPYLRDYIMDRGVMCDVAETSTTWSNLLPLYRAVTGAMSARFEEAEGGKGLIGCHISHTYPNGACLYFTYCAKQIPGDELAQYRAYKTLVTDTILRHGGTLSHHHAVGYEHLPWIADEISATGVRALSALKASLDPTGIMNPGKLIPASQLGAVTRPATDARLARARG
jgi:alkyldihydroxyacetonephosphate synthase